MLNMSLKTFLDQLASREPTPGGGGAAALMGALGAALLSMVAEVSLTKVTDETQRLELERQRDHVRELQTRLANGIESDALAFAGLMSAFRLPKGDASQLEARQQAIQNGYRQATLAPLDCFRDCLVGLDLARDSAHTGHRNVISDTGVAALALAAAVKSASLNLDINLPPIQDADFVDSVRQEQKTGLERTEALTSGILAQVQSRLS